MKHEFITFYGNKNKPVRFKKIKDNEWFIPTMDDHRIACCDCGLIHSVDFKIKDGRVHMRARRTKRKLHVK